jgi:hypothetical protein
MVRVSDDVGRAGAAAAGLVWHCPATFRLSPRARVKRECSGDSAGYNELTGLAAMCIAPFRRLIALIALDAETDLFDRRPASVSFERISC